MKSSRPGKPNTRALTLLWLVLFAAALAFSLWKLPYGFGGNVKADGDTVLLNRWERIAGQVVSNMYGY